MARLSREERAILAECRPSLGDPVGSFSHPHNGDRAAVKYWGNRIETGWLETSSDRRPVVSTAWVLAPDHDQAKSGAKELAEALRAAIGETDYGLEVLRNPRLRDAHPELRAPWERANGAISAWLDAARARGWRVLTETID